MSSKKYKITSNTTLTPCYKTVYQIQALIDIPKYGVKKGDKGGFVEGGDNLSHEGDCWVAKEAQAYDDSRIMNGALLTGQAQAYGQAHIGENALVTGQSHVYDSATVGGFSTVSEQAHVCEFAYVTEYAAIKGKSVLCGIADVSGETRVGAEAVISEGAFCFEKSDPELTDIAFPSENHLRDPHHPRFDPRLVTTTTPSEKEPTA